MIQFTVVSNSNSHLVRMVEDHMEKLTVIDQQTAAAAAALIGSLCTRQENRDSMVAISGVSTLLKMLRVIKLSFIFLHTKQHSVIV